MGDGLRIACAMPRQFTFGGSQFEAAGDAALYWPAHRALLFADLHLEKGSAYAAHGQMLPPYDSIATLDAVAELVTRFRPETVYCLGDNFHDDAGEHRLGGQAAEALRSLTAALDWTWIIGNHDSGLTARWGGQAVEELCIDGITLRHEAQAGWRGPEMSGHYHPKYRQVLRGRMVSRRCFLMSEQKLILPAFGALTGGLDVCDPAYAPLFPSTDQQALVPTSGRLLRFAVDRVSA
jgi:uncharacterized protein